MAKREEAKADELGHAWCCVYTHHGEETRAAGSLENDKGFQTYLPRLGTEKVVKGLVRRTWEPLFDRYLFVRLPLKGIWQPARYAKGVAKIVSSPSGDPLRISDATFQAIYEKCGRDRAEVLDLLPQEFCEKSKARRFEVGDQVRVLSGPFANWTGFVRTSKRDRVFVLLSIFGKETRTEVGRKDLELVA